MTGGLGNDTFDFESGGGIVTDYGIGSTKDGANKVLAKTATQKETSTYLAYNRKAPDSYARGADVIKVDGEVTGVYFERDASSKKDATFTAIITYDATPNDDTDADQIIVLKDVAKKPTKTNATNESKRIYQTNDVAAKTLKIWDTSTGNQRLLSSTNLNKLFYDDDALTETQAAQVTSLSDLVEGNNLVSTNDAPLQSYTTDNGTPYIFPSGGGISGIINGNG